MNTNPTQQPGDEEIVDDVVYEESEFAGDKIKSVKDKLKICEAEKQEYLDGWQRAQADIVNIKRRVEEEKREFAKYANENLILDIISTLDSFDMAFKNKESWEAVSANWRTGVEFIYNQLLSTLKNYGVEELNPIGEEFNPQKHHAVEGEEGVVTEVVLKGYSLNGKVIRAAQVKVG